MKYNPVLDPTYNGCRPNEPDSRDIVFGDIPFEADEKAPSWEQGYNVEAAYGVHLKREHQGSSLSCVGQGWSKYLEMLNVVETGQWVDLSAKDIYSQIFLPGGGANIRNGGKICVGKGNCRETLIPSYNNGNPPDEAFMEQKEQTAESQKDALIFESLKFVEMINYTSAPSTSQWEIMRQTIYQYHGFVAGYSGHCQYFVGYGIKNNKPFVSTIGSYGEGSDMIYQGEYPIFNITALVDLPNPPNKIMLNKSVKKKDGSEIYLIGSDGYARHISDMHTYQDLLSAGVIAPFVEEDTDNYPKGRNILHYLEG
jgi:hypothetical protein